MIQVILTPEQAERLVDILDAGDDDDILDAVLAGIPYQSQMESNPRYLLPEWIDPRNTLPPAPVDLDAWTKGWTAVDRLIISKWVGEALRAYVEYTKSGWVRIPPVQGRASWTKDDYDSTTLQLLCAPEGSLIWQPATGTMYLWTGKELSAFE